MDRAGSGWAPAGPVDGGWPRVNLHGFAKAALDGQLDANSPEIKLALCGFPIIPEVSFSKRPGWLTPNTARASAQRPRPVITCVSPTGAELQPPPGGC